MSCCVRRMCSSSCHGEYGSPAGTFPRAAGGISPTAASNPAWASSHPSTRERCSRISDSFDIGPSPHVARGTWHVARLGTSGTLSGSSLEHPRRIPLDHVVDGGAVSDVADAVQLIRRLEND